MLVHSVQPGNRESQDQFPKQHYFEETMWLRATRPRKPRVKVKSRGRVARDHTK